MVCRFSGRLWCRCVLIWFRFMLGWCVVMVFSLVSVMRLILVKWLFYDCVVMFYSRFMVCWGWLVWVRVSVRLWCDCGLLGVSLCMCFSSGMVSFSLLVCVSW